MLSWTLSNQPTNYSVTIDLPMCVESLQIQQEEVCRNTSNTAAASAVKSIQADEKTKSKEEVAYDSYMYCQMITFHVHYETVHLKAYSESCNFFQYSCRPTLYGITVRAKHDEIFIIHIH